MKWDDNFTEREDSFSIPDIEGELDFSVDGLDLPEIKLPKEPKLPRIRKIRIPKL